MDIILMMEMYLECCVLKLPVICEHTQRSARDRNMIDGMFCWRNLGVGGGVTKLAYPT
jgi:hypothetical protein